MTNKKRVLIITHDFYNNCPNVGHMVRMTHLANYLSNRGYKVNVLACKRDKTWNGLLNLSSKVELKFIKSFWNYKSTSLLENNEDNNKKLKIKKIFKNFKKLIRNLLNSFLVDRYQLGNHKYFAEASKMIYENGIKNVIVSGPRNSIYLVGLKLKKQFGPKINLITDYRDGWTIRAAFNKDIRPKTLKKFKKVEQEVLKFSDYTIFVSDGMKRMYQEEFDVYNPVVIENGFIEYKGSNKNAQEKISEITKRARKENRIIIGYFGTGSADGTLLYKDFLKLLKVFEQDFELANKFCIVSQGNIKYPKTIPSGLLVENLSSTSNEQARTNMSLVDILLFVYSEKKDAPMIMGGKIYDYIATGKPIWLLVPDNAFSLKLLCERTKKPIYSNIFDSEDIKKGLSNIIKLYQERILCKRGFNKREADLFKRNKQYEGFIEILK